MNALDLNPILPSTRISILAERTVEYATPVSSGYRVVRVFLQEPTPRVLALSLRYAPRYEESPMSLYLTDIEWYVKDATSRLSALALIGTRTDQPRT